MPLNPSEQLFFDTLAKQAVDAPDKPLSDMTIAEFRDGAGVFRDYADDPADLHFEDLGIPCQAGHTLQARYYSLDDQQRPLLIFFPGCGYVLDLFYSNHVALSKITKEAQCHALLVQFRLAPEHPFPVAFEDGLESVRYIIQHLENFNANSEQVILGGFSSGAGLTAALCHALKDSEIRIKHQLLFDGFYDYSDSLDAYRQCEEKDFLCNRGALKYLIDTCIPELEKRKDTRWSPYWEADFHNLPAATIIVPEYSGVRSQSEAYAKKLEGAGVFVNKTVLPGQTHNTVLCRKVLSGGKDPALVAGALLRKAIEGKDHASR